MVALAAIVLDGRAATAQFGVIPDAVMVDALLRSAGAAWQQSRSTHFVLYRERDVRMPLSLPALLDSLEAAWAYDTALVGAHGIGQTPVTVLVTQSPKRFPQILAPSSRGLMRRDSLGGEVIILVHNDSVRAFTRHEVMHVVEWRLWGPPGAPWVDEGIATFADGRCQSTTVLGVARDLLRAEPGLTAAGLAERYTKGAGPFLGKRLRAYVLAASFVDFIYDRGGAEALRVLRRDGIRPQADFLSMDSLTVPWRAYVDRAAAGKPGLASDAIDAHGCG